MMLARSIPFIKKSYCKEFFPSFLPNFDLKTEQTLEVIKLFDSLTHAWSANTFKKINKWFLPGVINAVVSVNKPLRNHLILCRQFQVVDSIAWNYVNNKLWHSYHNVVRSLLTWQLNSTHQSHSWNAVCHKIRQWLKTFDSTGKSQ